ncbi:MAG: hypothetical protein KDI39_14355 [Pseudomonadales bacterium]|nr:hypothetical protein [Pseudomonadales bacterium]HMX99905.1 hypothetical protein [Agitococcus sp.]
MVGGWGTGFRDFVGYGERIKCSNCNNNVIEHIYVTYSYEMFIVKWRHMGDRGSEKGDGYIQFLCPTCLHGFQIMGLEAVVMAKNNIAKYSAKHDTGKADTFAIDAQRKILAAVDRFDIQATKSWFNSIGFMSKRSAKKTLERVGLIDIVKVLDG